MASHCRRADLPLRCRGRIEAPSTVHPRLEAHLHRFGVIAIATFDLVWSDPVTLEDASMQVKLLESETAVIDMVGREIPTTIGSAATDAVGALVSVLGDARGQSWELPRHRLTTVIEGTGGESDLATMPAEGSPLQAVLHRLADGDDAIPKPSRAFVAQFTNASYGFPPTRMVYMLNKGTAALLGIALAGEPRTPNTASAWHRERGLLTAYVSALAGLVSASSQSDNVMFPAWAETAAKMLARLYGPGRGYLEWGRFPAELLHRMGTAPDVASVLGTPLAYNADYPFDAYEAATPAPNRPGMP